MTSRPDGSAELSRRTVLRAGALLALGGAAVPLSGCGLFGGDERTPEPDPLDPLVDEAWSLAAGLRAAATAHPDLAARLVPLAESHEAHAAELARLTGAATPSGSAVPTGASWSPAVPPGEPAAALAALRQAERSGRESAKAACAAAPAERAAVLGSVAAARASHLEALR
ncbi:hypothetical protein [Micromonospora sp. NPDC049900]|uniref:hypothetical protein n=1 Tax=unclassified Micromonospora TaxID=2617518 RepID=UPI0037A4A1A0